MRSVSEKDRGLRHLLIMKINCAIYVTVLKAGHLDGVNFRVSSEVSEIETPDSSVVVGRQKIEEK